MKVLHISASYKPAYVYGGPIYSVSALCETLSSLNDYDITVYTTGANGKQELQVEYDTTTNVDNVNVIYFKRITKDHSHFSPKLLVKLWFTASNFDLIHIHAWWNTVSVLSCLIAVLKRKKFVVSPRGTLSAYTFQTNSSKAKRLFHLILGKSLLKKGAFIVSSTNEREEIIKLIAPKSIDVIYNILSFPSKSDEKARLTDSSTLKLLFLSRIEKKKGLNILFKALAACKFKYHLSIVGEGDETYLKELQEQAAELAIDKNIDWIGAVYGKEKENFFFSNDLLVLPSFNENFANVVIESLLYGTPVLITENVGLADYVTSADLGWVCEANEVSIFNYLQQINKEKDRIAEKSERAPRIVKEDFDKGKLISKYSEMYGKVLQSNF
jgi:glycosyltransferase involved in cell wall biosynthesis